MKMTTLGSIGRIIIPKPIGYWVLPEKKYFAVYKKPKWLLRKITKIFLGWEYKANK